MKKIFQQLNIIFLALLGGQVAFAAVAYSLNDPSQLNYDSDSQGLGFVLPIIMLSAIAVAFWIYNQRKVQGAALNDVSAKAAHYRSSAIIRLGLTEGPNLLAVVLFLLEGNLTFLMYFGIGLLAFFFFRPSKDKFITDYSLSVSEQQELNAGV